MKKAIENNKYVISKDLSFFGNLEQYFLLNFAKGKKELLFMSHPFLLYPRNEPTKALIRFS